MSIVTTFFSSPFSDQSTTLQVRWLYYCGHGPLQPSLSGVSYLLLHTPLLYHSTISISIPTPSTGNFQVLVCVCINMRLETTVQCLGPDAMLLCH